ncbi:MAG: 50S ribosomal protein L18 [Zetaproteobacteria bacterium CG06_land_8_20_14_3_00_59_53]|nr:MAG: 50S ribosomal protein L18 [Zetaproteobacteria bacterium CG2_30_59_37]PIO90369.1 MAG: 50S ribosomal protein L18 [Zetaproteobacteria bacterium CG23_combo_of_CG06-09_8_20_14_all_59_86]PIQ65064.1 MAG: 50S ribosomal protein L18 [Zetaproteobacteria bacterium CG11_big_fil_rev_8_21_14_0_20_59_439]PIU70183.1 MAG: 50S ribosomal protein L18 [Zetaproteobacteria bacterium CG06_land_8_20_14_3_00_59_53]PIU96154.1 MAG: 50S ribosomal protein L18 [Zetaproteobacteria bacterium CG03_land_8_20_14_0_80_59_51
MSVKLYEKNPAVRRATRVRSRLKASGRLRLSVFRSARHIYAQVIDDAAGTTLVTASSLDADIKGNGNCATAAKVGKLLAERAKKAGIEEVAFDRGSFPYHGRVQALAEGAREAGLKF